MSSRAIYNQQVKHAVKKWTQDELKFLVACIKRGLSVTETRQAFPEQSYRQVDHKIKVLCEQMNLKRPVPLKRRTAAAIKKANIVMRPPEPIWNFAPQNIETHDRLGARTWR